MTARGIEIKKSKLEFWIINNLRNFDNCVIPKKIIK